MLVQPRLRLAAVVGSCTCVRTSMIALPMLSSLSCHQAMDGYAYSGTCCMLCSAPHVHVHVAFADVQPHVFLSLRTFSCMQYFKAACVSSNLYCALRAVHTGSAHLAVHTGSVHSHSAVHVLALVVVHSCCSNLGVQWPCPLLVYLYRRAL